MNWKPWQIWFAFVLCLSVVTAVMLWLSVRMVGLEAMREADRAETENARQDAELQERISASLYRMDLRLIPLVAEEAARPHQHYQAAYETQRAGAKAIAGDRRSFAVSPLYRQPSELVKLYFEVFPGGRFVSPQLTGVGEPLLKASLGGLPPLDERLEAARVSRLAKAKTLFEFETLRQRFPADEIELAQLSNFDNGLALQGNGYEVPAIDRAAEKFLGQRQATGLSESVQADSSQGKYAAQRQRSEDRLNEGFSRRRDSTRDIAQQQAVANVFNNAFQNSLSAGAADGIEIVYGVMKPLWVQGRLLLVRPLKEAGQTRYQCCWLDWEKIQDVLRAEVVELLPAAAIQFAPVQLDEDLEIGMALTTLPVQLSIDREKMRASVWVEGEDELAGRSSARVILSLAWVGFLLSTIAAGLLLGGVISLSERRADFVSAVTHELRTPLTTFRMYSEMLASGMVPPDKQQQYVGTLSKQADRLSHLVENVLQFARLERNPARDVQESVSLGAMVDRFSDRLLRRATEAGLEFRTVYFGTDGASAMELVEIRTVPAMVEQVLFNLVDNACKYGKPSGTGELVLEIGRVGGRIEFQVCDNGPGVDAKTRRKMFRPFHKSDLDAANSEPGVGLGLALCRRMAIAMGGALEYRDNRGGGATFVLSVPVE